MRTQFAATAKDAESDGTARLTLLHARVRQDTSVGRFRVWDGFEIAAKTRPAWLHRMMMRLVFGWIWIEN